MNLTCNRRAAIGGLAAVAAWPVLAADPVLPATLTPSAMATDVAILRRAYKTLHPGLYRYQTPA
ncbi:hypothetical protein R0J93_26470, partial [Pseudoalteromonas sp. SIMBA_148]